MISEILIYAIDNSCPFPMPHVAPKCLFLSSVLVGIEVSKIVPDQ